MKFEDALSLLKDGYKIRRKDIFWKDYYGFLSIIEEEENKIVSDNLIDDTYEITEKDLIADDWEVVE